MILAGTLSIKSEEQRQRTGKRWQDDLNFPLGSVISNSYVYVGQSIRKMSLTFVCIHVALFEISSWQWS
jgi:hypothetical protein